jgi:hypothetical protein
MLPRNRGYPDIILGDARTSLLKIGLDVAVMRNAKRRGLQPFSEGRFAAEMGNDNRGVVQDVLGRADRLVRSLRR